MFTSALLGGLQPFKLLGLVLVVGSGTGCRVKKMQSLYGVQASEAAHAYGRERWTTLSCTAHEIWHIWGAKRGACSPGFGLSLALINPNIKHQS